MKKGLFKRGGRKGNPGLVWGRPFGSQEKEKL